MMTIPIILAADNNYAPYMSVLMISILKNADNNTFFDFYLLVPDSFKEEYKQKIEKDCSFFEHKKLNFINMQNSFSTTKRMISHISEQAYYRLRAAEILPKNYDRCLYFDIDTIVRTDLTEFFNVNLEDCYVAGVKAPGYHFPEDGNKAYCDRIGISDISQYINSGVILLNLKKIREDNLTSVLCEEALKNYPTVDQDVINKVFYDHILHLPFKYNVMTKYKSIKNHKMSEWDKIQKLFPDEDLNVSVKNPCIVHYADKVKPWNNPWCLLADEWWKYTKQSCFYRLIIWIGLKKCAGKFFQGVFSVKNDANHKVLTIFGVKIKFSIQKYCPICKKRNKFQDFGKPIRTFALCPSCLSLERHRFLYFLYDKYFLHTKKNIKLLHTAPEKCIAEKILKNSHIDYTAIDLYPEQWDFVNCKKEDITNLSFPDNTFDFILSNQVMEHILDEKKYLSELFRVLKPGGLFILNFPIDFELKKTFQDDSIVSSEDREKYYGQYDHVRKYGKDIIYRLESEYNAKIVFAKDIVNKCKFKKYGFNNNDCCFLIKK